MEIDLKIKNSSQSKYCLVTKHVRNNDVRYCHWYPTWFHNCSTEEYFHYRV